MNGKFIIATAFLFVHVAMGQQYVQLVCRDSSECQCKPITDDSEWKIDCTDSSLNTTWIEPFYNMKNYVEISFANSRLTTLYRQHISRVYPEHVKRYNFANNKISEIEDHAFDMCTVLEVLNMRNNKLTTVDGGWFQGLWDSLLTLELSGNEIATIPDRAFHHLNNLKYLNLDGNPIVKLTDETFYALSVLNELSLDNTQISEVSGSVFTSLTTPNLETLSIRKSKMERLPLLRDLKNLKQVDFSWNDYIQSVQTNTFAKVPSITNVSLDFMRNLQTIEGCAFCGLTNLKFILISDSPKLTKIPKSAFDIGLGYGAKLDTVDFSNNSLTSLHPKMLPWRTAKNIRLEGNKWNCSCEIAWMSERSINTTDNPKCTSPSVLKSSPIKNITKIFGSNCMKRMYGLNESEKEELVKYLKRTRWSNNRMRIATWLCTKKTVNKSYWCMVSNRLTRRMKMMTLSTFRQEPNHTNKCNKANFDGSYFWILYLFLQCFLYPILIN